MPQMTEADADRLDDLYTRTTPSVDLGKPGVFAQHDDMVVVLDGFTSKYLASKGAATRRTPSEIISEMVLRELEAAV